MNAMRIVSLAFVSSVLTFTVATASPKTPRPADWISHLTPLTDTRDVPLAPRDCSLEIIELKFESPVPRAGAVLLIPGLFHDSFLFDLMPEQGVSYARWLMREKGLQVFMLHTRGIGESCYPKYSNLDDQAIDDVPTAIRYVSQELLGGEKIFVYGHSRGGINLQASLAGLDRCNGDNCFNLSSALERQSHVRGALYMGSNVAMTSDHEKHPLAGLAKLDVFALAISPLIDQVSSAILTEYMSPSDGKGPARGDKSLAYADFWEGTYHIPNVSKAARKAYYDNTMDETTIGILRQYAHGIQHQGIVATGGEAYTDGLPMIRVKSAMGVFEFDHYAELGPTERDDFNRLGAFDKRMFYYPGEGHEDFAMVGEFHAHQSELWDWMLTPTSE